LYFKGEIVSIIIGKYSNVQDNCVIHSSKGHLAKLEDYVLVGHAAVLRARLRKIL